uniref:Chemosensory protein n=1 Tax=Leucinodes orbonalis TaxID=711050 RepID=A0AAU0QL04_9NEOP|nr:chemosensory protein [Leucinodes orbonalis]
MKVLVLLSVFLALAAAAPPKPITKEELAILEAFDYDAVFANEESRKLIFDCLLDKGDCGPYKKVVELSKKSMYDECALCSPTQMAKYDRVLKLLHDDYETFYNELIKKVASEKE